MTDQAEATKKDVTEAEVGEAEVGEAEVGEADRPETLALNTKVEEDFVSPLTAIRGALEILRDFPELAVEERARFIDTALRGCGRLEQGVAELAKAVYAAAHASADQANEVPARATDNPYRRRIHIFPEMRIIEINFSEFQFKNADMVNDFYDQIDALVEDSQNPWYFLVNYRGCTVWPEAWVAFAHRGKKVNASYSLGTVRFAEYTDAESDQAARGQIGAGDADFFDSRQAALARIEEMKRLARSAAAQAT